MIGFGVIAKGLDLLVLGLGLSCLIRLSVDTIVETLIELASNQPYPLEDLCSQISPFFLEKQCCSPKRRYIETCKEMSLP